MLPMKTRAIANLLVAFVWMSAPLASAQVISNTAFTVSLSISGGCCVMSPESVDAVHRRPPAVICLNDEGFNMSRLASERAMDFDTTLVTPAVAGQAGTKAGPLMAARADDASVWLVTF